MKIIRSTFFLTWSLLLCCLAGQPTLAVEAATSDPTLRSSRISLGYRAVDVQDQAGRAAQYTLFDSGATVATEIKYLNPSLRFMIEGEYLNDSDYLLETDLDYRGLVRLHASTEKLYHHLDYLSYDRPDAVGTTLSEEGLEQVEVRFSEPVRDDPGGAGARREQTAQHADRGGFSRAVRAQESENLARRHAEGDVVHGREPAEPLGQALHVDRGRFVRFRIHWAAIGHCAESVPAA